MQKKDEPQARPFVYLPNQLDLTLFVLTLAPRHFFLSSQFLSGTSLSSGG